MHPYFHKLKIRGTLTDEKRMEVIRESIQKEGFYRCIQCGARLFKAQLGDRSHVQILCPQCKHMNVFYQTEK